MLIIFGNTLFGKFKSQEIYLYLEYYVFAGVKNIYFNSNEIFTKFDIVFRSMM
jgi:hypothetical protein